MKTNNCVVIHGTYDLGCEVREGLPLLPRRQSRSVLAARKGGACRSAGVDRCPLPSDVMSIEEVEDLRGRSLFEVILGDGPEWLTFVPLGTNRKHNRMVDLTNKGWDPPAPGLYVDQWTPDGIWLTP